MYIGTVSKKIRPTFPYRFEKNGRKGSIYRCKNGTFSTYFQFAGKNTRNSFATFEEAKIYLGKEFDTLDTNWADTASQNPLSRDRKYYSELELVLREQADGASLRDAVDHYLAHRPKTKFKSLTMTECKEKFLADKANLNLSNFQMKSLKKHLKRFEAKFGPRKMHEITAEEINTWLHSQKDRKTKKKWSIKYKINVHGTLVTFARHAKKVFKAFPPATSQTEFELVEKPKRDVQGEVDIYTPEELSKHLNGALAHDLELLPVILLCAFFGLRSTEAHGEETKRPKLKWDAFDWENNVLALRYQKIRSKPVRSIPIHPTAKEWLEPFKKLKGDIWKWRAAFDEKMGKLMGKIGCSRIDNGYRHSYASYRLIHLKHDYNAAAGELGNSPRELINSYRRNVLPKEADAWFAVKPPEGYTEMVAAHLSAVSK